MTKVTTITVSMNSREWLAECFGTLLASRTTAEVEFLLIDNASTDGSAELVAERFPGVHVMRNRTNLGFTGANNIGIAWALEHGSDYVFLVNPDTRTPEDLIERLTGFLASWPEYGLIGPLQHGYGPDADRPNDWTVTALATGEAHVFVHTWPRHASAAGPAAGRAPHTLEHAYVQGAALFVRAEVLRRIGAFDETYHSFYEETDLCRRVRWAGWRVALLLDRAIEHHGGTTGSPSKYRRRHMLRNKYYFLATDPDWAWRDIARLVPRWLLADIRRRGTSAAETGLAAAGDVLAGFAWLASRAPRIVRLRRAHAVLRRSGAGGPLRAVALPGDEHAG